MLVENISLMRLFRCKSGSDSEQLWLSLVKSIPNPFAARNRGKNELQIFINKATDKRAISATSPSSLSSSTNKRKYIEIQPKSINSNQNQSQTGDLLNAPLSAKRSKRSSTPSEEGEKKLYEQSDKAKEYKKELRESKWEILKY